MVKISVVMPVYNTCEKYFRIAIKSILNQTFKDFELIIVDDYSDEYIRQVVDSYDDKRIKYYRLSKNSGAAVARNFGIEKSAGKYLAFLDSDDVSYPERLALQYDFLENHKDIGCLGTDYIIKGKNTRPFAKNVVGNDNIIEHLLFKGCVFCQSTVMLRKEILTKNNIKYRNEYVPAEDYALWLDLIGKTKFELLENVLVLYRFHIDNISHKMHEIQKANSLKAQIHAIERICNIKIPKLEDVFSICQKVLFEFEDIKNFENILSNKSILQNKLLYKFFKSKAKRIFYHSHGFRKQFYLLHSPLVRYFKFPIFWRMFVFITRIF